jgi:hypothetical protein
VGAGLSSFSLVDPCFCHQSEGTHALTSACMYCAFLINVLSACVCNSIILFKLCTFPSLTPLLYSHTMHILQLASKTHLWSLSSYHAVSVKSNSHTWYHISSSSSVQLQPILGPWPPHPSSSSALCSTLMLPVYHLHLISFYQCFLITCYKCALTCLSHTLKPFHLDVCVNIMYSALYLV